MLPPQQLSDDAVEVLYVLWMERFKVNFFDEGLTSEEIRERTDDLSTFARLSTNSVYAALKELTDRADRWPTIAEVRKKTDASGRKPRAYVLYGDGVSDWPRSSFAIMELNEFDRKKRPRQISAQEFCQHLLDNCGYRHQDDLDAIITGLSSLDYVYHFPARSTLATSEVPLGYLTLALNERARSEQAFIRKVALHYPDEVEKDGRKIKHSLFLINSGYYKDKQNPPASNAH
jgi:hypothetical protein